MPRKKNIGKRRAPSWASGIVIKAFSAVEKANRESQRGKKAEEESFKAVVISWDGGTSALSPTVVPTEGAEPAPTGSYPEDLRAHVP